MPPKTNNKQNKIFNILLQNIQKPIGYHPVHLTRKKVQPNGNQSIYCVFSTSDHRSWYYSDPNPLRNTPQNWHSKKITSDQARTSKLIKTTPSKVPESIKNQWKSNPGAQGVLFGAPIDLSTTNCWLKVQKTNPKHTKVGPQSLKK